MDHKEHKNDQRCTSATEQAGHSRPPVTFTQALSFLFAEDMHPTTGISDHTIESYKTTFRLLMCYHEQQCGHLLRPDTPIEQLDASLVRSFLKHLSEARGSSASTINVRRAAFCAMARSVQRRYPELTPYCRSIEAIPSRRTKQPLVGYFELDELKAIFDAVDTSRPDGFRDMVLLRCLYNTGGRASEICGLRTCDLRLDDPAHLVLNGKGGKARIVPIWPQTAELLRAYLHAARRRPKAGHEPFVFIGRKGVTLTRFGLYRIARRYLDKAAEQQPKLLRNELHPVCSFRHTTATHLLWAGESLTVIQEILGHVRAETTQRYRSVSLHHKRQALQRLIELRQGSQEHIPSSSTPLPEWADSEDAITWLERL